MGQDGGSGAWPAGPSFGRMWAGTWEQRHEIVTSPALVCEGEDAAGHGTAECRYSCSFLRLPLLRRFGGSLSLSWLLVGRGNKASVLFSSPFPPICRGPSVVSDKEGVDVLWCYFSQVTSCVRMFPGPRGCVLQCPLVFKEIVGV